MVSGRSKKPSGRVAGLAVLLLATTALAALPGVAAHAADPAGPRIDHDLDHGRDNARMSAQARTTSVNPATGPDFELPFACGQVWNGSSRSSHSPSYYTIDFNRVPDRGQPALASAPGVVTRVVTLTGSYGRYVVIDHGGGWSTLYAHLDGFTTTVGAFVDQGDQIGIVGGSGGVTGPHLHFEERKDGAYFPPYFHRSTFRMNSDISSQNCNDKPISGDWDGDGKTEVGIVRAGSSAETFYTYGTPGHRWGGPADLPVAADFDGDSRAQVGVRRRQSTSWYLRSSSGATATVGGVGGVSDIPITGDWDGNGREGLGYFRSSTHTFYLRADNGSYSAVSFGSTGQQPVVGDWNGDGVSDLGTYDPMTGRWSLRVPSGSSHYTRAFSYGTLGDLPVTGDWDGDGVTDIGVWRSGTATFWQYKPGYKSPSVVYGVRRG